MPRKPGKIEAAQVEEAERLLLEPDSEAHAGELTAGSRWRRLAPWLSRGLDLWTARFERLGKWLTAIAKALGAAGVIGGLLWRAIVVYKTRSIAPAEEQKTGISTTFADRVDKPKAP